MAQGRYGEAEKCSKSARWRYKRNARPLTACRCRCVAQQPGWIVPSPASPKPSRSRSAASRSRRRRSAPIMPMWPNRWPPFTSPKAATPRPTRHKRALAIDENLVGANTRGHQTWKSSTTTRTPSRIAVDTRGRLPRCASNVGDYPVRLGHHEICNCKRPHRAAVARRWRTATVVLLLPADEVKWPEVRSSFAWTAEHVKCLETAAWLKADSPHDNFPHRKRSRRTSLKPHCACVALTRCTMLVRRSV